MPNSEEKVSKFVQAITAYAEEQRDKILREAEAFKMERLQKAEEEVLTESYKLIQQETVQIRNEGVREMSRRDLAARKDVLARRRQIMDEVFSKAEQKLLEYASSPDYPDYLEKQLKQMVQFFPVGETVYAVSLRDAVLVNRLSSLCPLGGRRATNPINGQIVDNTLDSKLRSQHEWFTISSGLIVG